MRASEGRLAASIAIVAILVLSASCLALCPAHGQSEPLTGGLYLSSVPNEQVPHLLQDPQLAEPFEFYLVLDYAAGSDPTAPRVDFLAWECSVHVPDGLVVLDRALNPPTSLNVGAGQDNWIVGTGVCVDDAELPYAVVNYTAMLLEVLPPLSMVTLGPSTPSSGPANGNPAWLGCDSVIYPSTLGPEESSLLLETGGDDFFPPELVSAEAPEAGRVIVEFNEMVRITAEDPSHYRVYRSDDASVEFGVASANLSMNGKQVQLELADPLVSGANYTVEVSGVEDLAGNPIDPPATRNFAFPGVGSPRGRIYASAEPNRQVSELFGIPFEPITWYVLAEFDETESLFGYEFGLDVPSDIIVLSAIPYPPLFIEPPCDFFNWVMGTGSCLEIDQPFGLVTYEALTFVPVEDGLIRVRGVDSHVCGTHFEEGPGWLTCGETLVPFESWAQEPLVINPTGIVEPNYVEFSIDDAEGAPGEIATARVLGDVPLVLKAASGFDLAGFDLTLTWDATVAEAIEVRAGDAIPGWSVVANPWAGAVQISVAGLESVEWDFNTFDTELLQIDYQLAGESGESPLHFAEITAYDIDLEALGTPTTDGMIVVGCAKGDVTGDGRVDSADAIRTLQIGVGLYDPTPTEFCAADMNESGDVDVGDAVLVLRKAVGLDKGAATVATDTGSRRLAAAGAPAWADLIPGNEPRQLRLELGGAAGSELILRYDPARLRFVGSRSDGDGASSSLALATEPHPGLVRIATAGVDAADMTLLLSFETPVGTPVASGGSGLDGGAREASSVHGSAVVELLGGRAFGENGGAKHLEIGSAEAAVALGKAIPRRTALLGAAPNPFNPRTQIRFALAQPGDVHIRVYDAAGRLVRAFEERGLAAGEHAVDWNGTDENGRSVASGVYTVRMDSEEGSFSTKATLLK